MVDIQRGVNSYAIVLSDISDGGSEGVNGIADLQIFLRFSASLSVCLSVSLSLSLSKALSHAQLFTHIFTCSFLHMHTHTYTLHTYTWTNTKQWTYDPALDCMSNVLG